MALVPRQVSLIGGAFLSRRLRKTAIDSLNGFISGTFDSVHCENAPPFLIKRRIGIGPPPWGIAPLFLDIETSCWNLPPTIFPREDRSSQDQLLRVFGRKLCDD